MPRYKRVELMLAVYDSGAQYKRFAGITLIHRKLLVGLR